MKNLKRTLSLVLALVLAVGLLTVGAGAAFKDDAQITYKEAVDLLTGLGVINGYPEDNTFRPTENFDRGGLAKMVAYFSWGGKDLSNYYQGSNVFADLDGYGWAKGSINYGYNAGYITGTSATTYNPTGTVKGSELAKTVLVVLGYDPKSTSVQYALEGANWELNAIRIATQIGLYDNLGADFDPTAALTREQAAQIFYNALFLNTVDAYKDDGSPKTSNGDPIATSTYKMNKADGVLTENAAIKAGATYSKINATDYKITTGLDLIGHNVTVYYKDTNNVYAVIDNSTTFEMTAKTTQKELNAALGVATDPASYSYTQYDGSYASSTVTSTPQGTAGTAIIFEKEVIGFVLPTTYTLDKVSNIVTTAGSESIALYNGGSSTLSLSNNATSDVVDEYAGIAKDDYVVYSKTGDVYHLSKATTVSGAPARIDDSTVTIGGVNYAKAGTDKSDLTEVLAANMAFDKEYTLYLDGQGNYITATAKAGGTITSDVVYLVAKYSTTEAGSYGSTITTYWAQCVDMAGNQVIYQLTQGTYNGISDGTDTATLKKVTVSYDDTLKANVATFDAANQQENGSATVAANAVKINDNHYFASDVKFIYITGAKSTLKVEVKDGVQALTNKSVEYIAEQVGTTSNYTVKYVVVEAAYEAPEVAGSGVIFANESAAASAKVPYTKADGTTGSGYEHVVYIDGVKTTIITEANTAITGFNTYKVDGNLYTLSAKTADNLKAAAAVTNMYNGMISTSAVTDLSVSGATVVNLTDNTLVPTDPTALSTADTVALVLNADLNAVVTVYVTASTRA